MSKQQQIDISNLISPSAVAKTIEKQGAGVFSHSQVLQIVGENESSWHPSSALSQRSIKRMLRTGKLWHLDPITARSIVEALLDHSLLKRVKLNFPHRAVERFTWGDVSILELVQSIDPNAYFSHYTAMQLHGLTEQIPKTIYVNQEQAAAGGGGILNQAGIDRAFRGKCRVSKSAIEYQGVKICRLHGKNTGNLGVIRFQSGGSPSRLQVTNIERTLIDITVRPVYAGGVAEVAKAFRMAADRLSINKLAAYLRDLNYTYPYHQALGFYLDIAGAYKEPQIDLLRQFPIEYDFYLTYEMKNPEYDPKWRLFYPNGFQPAA